MTVTAPAPARKRKFPWWIYWLVFAFILLFMISPIFPVTIAESTAQANGCALTEGYVSPCVVDGNDVGEWLYTLGMMGWLFLVSGPLGILALGLWLIIVVIHRILWGRARKREAAVA